MNPLLFVASDRRELEPWAARWNSLKKKTLPVHWFRSGNWRGRDMIAVANGVGAQRATMAVEAVRQAVGEFSGICCVGTGGALDPSLAIADVVVATAVTDGRQTWNAISPGGPTVRSGLVRSVAHIARTIEEKGNLRQAGAIIVEMEAAGVAKAALELAVPFYCVRVVSDLANETLFMDFEKFLMPDGRFNVPSLVLNALAHPFKGLPELLRLQKRTSEAASQLGNFLASCDFPK